MISFEIQSNPSDRFLSTNTREITKYSDSKNQSFYQPYSANSDKKNDLKEELKNHKWAAKDIYLIQREWLENQTDLIADHVDRRIQLFFQQAILCYNTPFYFDAVGAEDQIGSGRTISLERITFRTQAAHSSTLPCLYAYPRNNDGTIDISRKFVFLKHSQAYTYHNSTVESPISVNQTDTSVDITNGLRKEALKIINDVALGILDPKKATIKFLKRFKKILETSLDKLNKDDLRYFVIKRFYLPRVNHALAEFKNHPDLFDQILGVKLGTKNKEDILREIVYRERYKLIQAEQDIESKIARRILEAQNQIFPNKQKKSLSKIDNNLRFAILSQSRESLQKRLSKLFCTSTYQLLSSFNEKARSNKIKNSESFSEKHKAIISNLLRDIRNCFRELEKLEFTYRSQLFRNLRTGFKNWTQKKLVEVFKKRFPAEPMSQSMVSRLEQVSRTPRSIIYKTPDSQRRRELDVSKAKKLAKVLEVDLGVFLPSLITSHELN